MMELADVMDSKSIGLITRAGSTPAAGTIETTSSEVVFSIENIYFSSAASAAALLIFRQDYDIMNPTIQTVVHL